MPTGQWFPPGYRGGESDPLTIVGVPIPPGGFSPDELVPPGSGYPVGVSVPVPVTAPPLGPDGKPILPGGLLPTLEDWQSGVDRLFAALFDRSPDQPGRDFWAQLVVDQVTDFEGVAREMLKSPEAKQKFIFEASDEEYCSNLYVQILDRAADSSGLSFWLGELQAGSVSREGLLINFANSPENILATEYFSG